jgi:hypothetical protein
VEERELAWRCQVRLSAILWFAKNNQISSSKIFQLQNIFRSGGGQSKAAWFVRSLPCVKGVFERIWDTDSLLTSMDTFICWRPWWRKPKSLIDESWKPIVERLHCDQSPVRKPGFHCVQGMAPLLRVDEFSGGLQVGDKIQVPLSHDM